MKTSIGLDLGGTSIKYALIDETGEIIHQGIRPSSATVSAEAVIDQLSNCIEELRNFISTRKDIVLKGIGIGTPGIIDETNRVVLGGAENIRGWENIPLAQIIEKKTNISVVVANDANAMGLGETMFGAGQNFKHIIFLTVGTGIGSSVIIDGKLFNGYANRGAELGHVPFIANGLPCACGSVGCLETYASTSALVRFFMNDSDVQSKKAEGMKINGKYIVDRYLEGDPLAVRCLNNHCNYLGHGIAGFINIFSPQLIVVGGGLPEAGDFYMEKVREAAFRYVMKDCAQNTLIVATQLGNMAGTIGAASLVFSLIN